MSGIEELAERAIADAFTWGAVSQKAMTPGESVAERSRVEAERNKDQSRVALLTAIHDQKWQFVALVEDVHELMELDTLVTGTEARAGQIREYLRQRKKERDDVAPLPFDEYVYSDNGFARRIRVDLATPAEKAIRDAVRAVECSGAHPWLTRAVILLGEALDRVADYVDDQTNRASDPKVNGEPYCTDCGGRPGDHSPECTKGDLAIKIPDAGRTEAAKPWVE